MRARALIRGCELESAPPQLVDVTPLQLTKNQRKRRNRKLKAEARLSQDMAELSVDGLLQEFASESNSREPSVFNKRKLT